MAGKKAEASKGKIKITQVRGANKRTIDQQMTLRGLGLRGIRKSAEVEDTPAVRGMIAKVRHLLQVG